MGLTLTPITGEDLIERRRLQVGITLFDAEGVRWTAWVPEQGLMQGQGGLGRLPGGLWVCDCDFDRSRALAATNPTIRLRSSSYFRVPLGQIVEDAGLETFPQESAVRALGLIANRLSGLSAEVFAEAASGAGASREIIDTLRAAPSLPTAILRFYKTRWHGGPAPSLQAIEFFEKAFQSGLQAPTRFMGTGRVETDDLELHFILPRLAHALAVASDPVPAPGEWQMARRDPAQGQQAFLEALKAINRPVIAQARPQGQTESRDDVLDGLANGGRSAGTYRAYYPLGEIEALADRFALESPRALVGPGWRPSITGELLSRLIDLAGGIAPAHACLSVGLLADNILAASMRGYGERGRDGLKSAEGLWIAARDRLATLPLARALSAAGALFQRAFAGTVSVRVPRDPEILAQVTEAAWARGASLSSASARRVAALGVHPPVDLASFGGPPTSFLLARLMQRAMTARIFSIDALLDQAAVDRAPAWERLIKGSQP